MAETPTCARCGQPKDRHFPVRGLYLYCSNDPSDTRDYVATRPPQDQGTTTNPES